jgi:hypothetical protein
MLLRRVFLFVVLVVSLVSLSACGTQPSKLSDPDAQLWSEEQFATYVQNVSSQSSLSSLMQGQSALASLAAIPAGGPIGDLSALARPDSLREADVAASLMQGLTVAGSPAFAPANNNGGAQPLPTGIWEYNKFKNIWSYLGASDNLGVRP